MPTQINLMQYLPILSIIIALVVPFLAWITSDARFKARLNFITEKVNTNKAESSRIEQSLTDKTSQLEIKLARSEQDSIELHRVIEKLDNQKASKEVVDGFRAEMVAIKQDMDKRFDKLERLLESVIKNK